MPCAWCVPNLWKVAQIYIIREFFFFFSFPRFPHTVKLTRAICLALLDFLTSINAFLFLLSSLLLAVFPIVKQGVFIAQYVALAAIYATAMREESKHCLRGASCSIRSTTLLHHQQCTPISCGVDMVHFQFMAMDHSLIIASTSLGSSLVTIGTML